MKFDDNDQVDSNDQVESAPVYPPTTRTAADASATAEAPSDRLGYDSQVSDREIPRQPMADAPADAAPVEQTALFERRELDGFNGRWSEIQASFVDEPRRAVEQADTLVAEVIQQLAKGFADERSKLEQQWSRGDNISTEDLRLALRRYRSFFDRLLTM